MISYMVFAWSNRWSNLYQALIERANLVVGDHVVEGVVQLVRTLLDLQLLPVDLVLDVVDPLVQLGDVHLAVLEPGLSDLVLALQVVDLLNELLLPLKGLLSGGLELLHVLTNGLQLLLDILQVLLGQLGPLNSPLELSLLHTELPGELVKLLLVVGRHLDGGSQVLVQLLDGDLVVEASVLNNLNGLHDVVGGLGGEGKLGDGLAQLLGGLLVLLLHEHDPPGEGGDVALDLLELLLGLLEGLVGLGELVVGLIEADLELLHFLAVVTDVTVSLISPADSLPGGLLEAGDGLVEPVRLGLERLHLLPDRVHLEAGELCVSWREL